MLLDPNVVHVTSHLAGRLEVSECILPAGRGKKLLDGILRNKPLFTCYLCVLFTLIVFICCCHLYNGVYLGNSSTVKTSVVCPLIE